MARNDGRLFNLGIALQAVAGQYTAPTNWLRALNPGNLLPELLERRSSALMGTPFELPAEAAGNSFLSRAINGEATVRDLGLMLTSMFGTPNVATSIITPSLTQAWNDNFLMQPLSAQAYIPNAGTVQVIDAQIADLTVTVPEATTDNVTYAATMSAGQVVRHPDGAPLNGFAPAAMPPQDLTVSGGKILGRIDHALIVGGQGYCPSGTSVVRFYNPIVPLPYCGANIPGFGAGTDPVGVELQFAFNKPIESVLAASESKAFLPATWRLARAGSIIEVTGNFQVSAREVSVAPGRLTMPVTLRARAQTTGDVPFSIKVISA